MVKKLLLLGFGLVLLIGLPLTIFVLQNQSTTQTQSGAAPVTKFSFSGPTSVNNGQSFDETITVDPGGTNQVSFVKFTFTYDNSVLDVASPPVTIDTTKYTILDQPSPTCASNTCTFSRTISIGSNQTAVIKSPTPIAVMHFIAKGTTDSSGTQLAFVTGQNQALSVGSTDQPAENVFQSGTPTTIVIGGSSSSTTPTDTPTPTPGGSGSTGGSTGGSGGSGGSTGGSAAVSCDSFTADTTSGNPPLTVTFTTVGSSTTDTISQIALTYGDGGSDTVATGSGIGTGNINNQISHVYNTNGTFTAQATLTTAGGATSDSTACKQTITVGSQVAANNASSSGSLPPTGPGQTILLIGAAGTVLSLVGLAVLAGL